MTVRVSQQPPQPLLSTATSSLVTPSQSSSYPMHRDSPTSSIRDDASSTSSLGESNFPYSPHNLLASELTGFPLSTADGRQRKRLYKNPETATATIPQTSSHRELRSPVKQRKPSGMREQKNPYLARSSASPTKSYVSYAELCSFRIIFDKDLTFLRPVLIFATHRLRTLRFRAAAGW